MCYFLGQPGALGKMVRSLLVVEHTPTIGLADISGRGLFGANPRVFHDWCKPPGNFV